MIRDRDKEREEREERERERERDKERGERREKREGERERRDGEKEKETLTSGRRGGNGSRDVVHCCFACVKLCGGKGERRERDMMMRDR